MQSNLISPNMKGTWRSDLTPEWNEVWRAMDPPTRAYVAPFVTEFNHLGLGPNDELRSVAADLCQRLLSGHAGDSNKLLRSKLNCGIGKWNAASDRLTLCTLDRIPTESDALKNIPDAVRRQIEAYAEILRSTDAPSTVVTKINRLYDLVAIAQSVKLKFSDIAELATEDNLDRLAEAPEYGPITKLSSRRNDSFAQLRRLLVLHVKDFVAAATVENTEAGFPKEGADVARSTRRALAAFDNPDAMTDLLELCVKRVSQFADDPMPMTMAGAQAGIAVPLFNALAAKRLEIHGASFSGPVRQNSRVPRPSLIATIGGTMENLDLILDDRVIDLIDQYWLGAVKLGRQSKWLFENMEGDLKAACSLSVSVNSLGREAGLNISPQRLRDLAIKRMIEEIESSGKETAYECLKETVTYTETRNLKSRYRIFRQRIVGELIRKASENKE